MQKLHGQLHGQLHNQTARSIAPGLRSDGADLFVERTDDYTAVFRLHIPDQACANCIMPSRILLPMFAARVASIIGPGWSVTLDDTRDDATHPLNRHD